jgi:hypothetical protein
MQEVSSFEDQLAAVRGKIRRLNMWNFFDRYHDGLLYYYNRAERLKDGAVILWDSGPIQNDTASMLAGLSIELLIKGTILALQGFFPHCHKLDCLIATAGISVDDRDHLTSRLLTEYIVWAAKYPTPTRAEDWFLDETGGWPLSMKEDTWNSDRRKDYEHLWNTLHPYFWRVQEATFESAELDAEDYGRLRQRPPGRPHQCTPRRI